METRKRATRSTTTKANGVSSPKPTTKLVKAETSKSNTKPTDTPPLQEKTPTNNEDIIIEPDSKTTTPKITEQEHIAGLFLPPSATPTPQPSEESFSHTISDLPYKYAVLEDFFNALLNAYMCMKGRKQACTWSIVRESVESLCNRRFELSDLARMITVLPGALKLAIWKHASNRSGQDLAIEIISPSSSQLLTYSSVPQIRESFRTNLLSTATLNHTAFLKKKKLKAPASSQWHPSFKQDAVPDIPQAPLPSFVAEIKTPILKTTENEEMEEEDANLTSDKGTEHHTGEALTKPIPEELVGLSASTIAAARAHEEAEKEESEEVKITRRLPMVARTMHNLCVTEKKRAFPKKNFINQMVECSASPLSHEEAETSLERIAKMVPQWISLYKTDDEVEWVRFSRDVTLGSSLATINKIVKEVISK